METVCISKEKLTNDCVCCGVKISTRETVAKFDYVLKVFVDMCKACAEVYEWTEEEQWYIEEFGIESFRVLVKEIQQQREMEKII